MSDGSRFWSKVDKAGPVAKNRPDLGRCWLWMGRLSDRGYGYVYVDGGLKRAHKVAWQWVNGPVPDGLELDHVHVRGEAQLQDVQGRTAAPLPCSPARHLTAVSSAAMTTTAAGHCPQALSVLTGALRIELPEARRAEAFHIGVAVFAALHDAGLRIVDQEDMSR